MPSNKELAAEIKAVNPDAETDGLSNAQLATALKALRATPEESKAGEEAPEYEVGSVCLTTIVGVLEEGDPIEADFLPGGKDQLEELVDRGLVVKN